MRTKTDETLAAAERQHADDPERAELLARARRFKASWIELAEGLTAVRTGNHWKRWGYPSFEEYTRKELHLRQETVAKLTGSYLFLKKSAPSVLERNGLDAPIPSYQSVDFLRRAEEVEMAPEGALDEIRRRVIDDAAPLPGLSRKFREIMFPLDAEQKKAKDSSQLRLVARRLHELVGETRVVPRRLAEEVKAAMVRLLEALGTEQDESEAA